MFQYPVVSHDLLKRYVVEGWHLNPVVQVQNGLPYSVGTSGTITGAFSSGMSGTGSSSYLLQIGRNTRKMPSTVVVDSRLQKDISLNERLNIELVAEAFNLLNYVNATGISSTAYTIGGCVATAAPETCNLTYNPLVKGGGVSAQSGFGAITNADSNFVYSQRQIQLGVKFDF